MSKRKTLFLWLPSVCQFSRLAARWRPGWRPSRRGPRTNGPGTILLSSYYLVLLSSYPSYPPILLILLCSYPPILLSSCHLILLSSHPPILLSCYPPILLSSYPPILLSFYLPILVIDPSLDLVQRSVDRGCHYCNLYYHAIKKSCYHVLQLFVHSLA